MVCNTANNLNAFNMQLRCFYPVISLTFHPKSNAIAKQEKCRRLKEGCKTPLKARRTKEENGRIKKQKEE
jgi:hypothetical protein